MNGLAVVFCVVIASASCSPLWGGAVAYSALDGSAFVKGPVTSSFAVGPDGSSISSVEDHGAVAFGPRVAPVAPVLPPPVVPAPVVPAPVVPAPLPPPVVPAPVVPAPVAPAVVEARFAPAVLPPPVVRVW